MFVNSNQSFPLPAGDNFNLPALNFTQFLSPYFGLTIGKFATITSSSGDMNEFAHGKGDTQFMNTAFNVNPILLTTVPYSTLGTGMIVLPTKDPNQAIVSFLVLSSTGKASTSGFDDLDGNNLLLQVRVGCGRTFSDSQAISFSARPFPTGTLLPSIRTRASSSRTARSRARKAPGTFITISISTFTSRRKARAKGIGIFGRFGASDGNPNFMQFFYSLGIGGKGVIPNRHNDRYGLGFYYIDANSPEFQGVFNNTEVVARRVRLRSFLQYRDDAVAHGDAGYPGRPRRAEKQIHP